MDVDEGHAGDVSQESEDDKNDSEEIRELEVMRYIPLSTVMVMLY